MLKDQKLKDIIYQKYVKEQKSYNEVIKAIKQKLHLEITKSQLKYIIQKNKWQRKQNVNAFSQDEQEKIFALYKEHKTASEIAKILNIKDSKRVHAFLRRNNLYAPRSIHFKLSEDDINNICVMYQSGFSASKILEQYNHLIKCEKTILKIIKEKGIPVRSRGVFPNIKKEDFFDKIQSENQAYILGWLISDGYIIYPKNKTPHWGLTVQSNDRYILEYIKDIVGIDKKIVDTIRTRTYTKNTTYESELTVVSQKMVQDLSKYGIVPQKSKIIHMPSNIPKLLMPHLIRGIFDGDGCIYKNKITFYGNQYMMSEIQDFLNQELNIPKYKISFTQSCYCFTFSKEEEVKKFYDYLYHDAHIYLKRKKERFHKLSYIK